jgi:serine/threonine-protein kinase HipA
MDNRPSLETVLATSVFYGLSDERGAQIVEEVAVAVDGWQDAARQAGIARGDVELTGSAFSAHTEYRSGSGKKAGLRVLSGGVDQRMATLNLHHAT